VGENRLWIELRDDAGEPVDDVELSARVHMHAMGSMAGMGGPTAVERVGPGRFRAAFELVMGGTWQAELRAQRAGGAAVAAEGSLTVGTPGVRLSSAAGEPPAADPGRGAHPAEFAIAPERVQRIGVRTAVAERAPLTSTIRALGIVTWDETALADVSLKVRGWVRTLEADALGDRVEAGQVLFSVYSPELYAAQQEYLLALRSRGGTRPGDPPHRADYLVRAARRRLELWDVAASELDALARRGTPLEALPIRAPRGGYVIEKSVVAGGAIEPGQRLYRIAPLEKLWIEADLYEGELAFVHVGQPARVELAHQPGLRQEARVAWIYPQLDREARTARVRLEIENPELALRPDMYATVTLEVDHGERLLVPQSAVLHAGRRSFVFLALGEGRFRPQAVETGLELGEQVEILSGIEAGTAVVSSATFLIASESRLRAALEQW
jgi:Cu(I)/Ag(I) efflux system membrane fusion protein